MKDEEEHGDARRNKEIYNETGKDKKRQIETKRLRER